MQIHPSDLLLKEAFQERNGSRRVIEHVDSCAWCRQRLKTLVSRHLGGKPPDYGPILDRSFRSLQRWQAEYARERAEAPGLLSALLNMPRGRQVLILRNHGCFQTWSLLEFTLSESQQRVFDDAHGSEDLAALGLILADHLNPVRYGLDRIEDLRARAWALIGNSRRVRFDLSGAEQAFAEGLNHLHEGTGDVFEYASFLELQASLLRLQSRFSDSLKLLQRASGLFKRIADEHHVGRILVQMAILHYRRERYDQGIPLLRRAIQLIDGSLEPRSLFCARHDLIFGLASKPESLLEAQVELARAHPLYVKFSQPWAQASLLCVEAKIARGTGRLGEAKGLLSAAHAELVAANLGYHASLLAAEIKALPQG
ncbi:MAG: hypothetical protein QOF89_2493 [Acidobacteriota bacterium]|jgi:tetratricopeptide (TPR) repeat protein|nr:hypothetical protein [Acidobacteriota bacterium]